MKNPHLAVSYIDKFSGERFVRFSSDVEAPNLSLLVESRPVPGPFAALEWLIPTAVVVYIAKSYFESFLKEMGKDHYVLLKGALKNLGIGFLGKNAPQIRLISTPAGKVLESKNNYSLVFSIVAEIETRLRVKVLLQSDLAEATYAEALEKFLQFLEHLHDGTLSSSEVKGLDEARPTAGYLLVAFNPQEKILEVIDPVPRKSHPKI
ncbi:MAG TPA: hypothetical protein VGJ33_19700 [Candidatus Angelobacter sp.]|jgi:hypothetical protein